MNKWPLLALVVFVAVLGVCYSVLTRQGYRDGDAAGPGPQSTAPEEGDLEEGDGKGDNSFVLTDDDETASEAPAAAPKLAQRPNAKGAGSGNGVETIEDDEENGVVVDVPPSQDDENGIIEAVRKPRSP